MTDDTDTYRFIRQEQDDEGRYVNVWENPEGKTRRTLLFDPSDPPDWYPTTEA